MNFVLVILNRRAVNCSSRIRSPSIFNSSFSLAHCPCIWRDATIIPLLKAGKPPGEVASFRPIILTSCVFKRLECILAGRFYYTAKTKNLFSRFQAGFRKGRSYEDQKLQNSTWSNNSTWQPALFIGTQKIWVNVTPRLLGVILYRSLTFNAPVKKLTIYLSSSLRIIRATVHTSWGCYCSTLKIAFHALIRSNLDYAASAWQPWLSTTNLSCLDHLQNRSLWLITGQLLTTSLEVLHLEGDVQNYHTCSNHSILKAWERSLRSMDHHPKHVALAANIPRHLQNCWSFCRKAADLSTFLPAELEDY